MKKTIIFTLMVLLIVSLMGGLVNAKEKVTIRILTRWSGTGDSFNRGFQELLDKFSEKYPNIIVEDLSINDEQMYNDKLKSLIAAGDPPEIAQTYGGGTDKVYVENGIYINLDKVMTENPEWVDKFIPSTFNNWRYDNIDGTYGVPVDVYGVALFYNKDLFEKIDSDPPVTMEELFKVSRKFNEKGITPMAFGVSSAFKGGHLFNTLLIKKYGLSKIKDLITRKAKFDDPEMMEVFKLIAKMNEEGVFGKITLGRTYTEEKSLFHNEKTAMHMDGSWYLGEVASSSIADKVGVIQFPYFKDSQDCKNNMMGGAGAGLTLTKSALETEAKKRAAEKLLKYLTSIESFKYWQEAMNGGVWPVEMAGNPETVSSITIEFMEVLSKAQLIPEYATHDTISELQVRLREEIQGIFAGYSPENAARNIAEVVEMND